MSSAPRYVIISPVKDEVRHIELTLRSVVSQTLRPSKWIVVDDGSKDATAEVVRRYAAEYPFIECASSGRDAARLTGTAEAQAFKCGQMALAGLDYDFIVKLDGDLSFEADYFERLMRHFTSDPQLGIASGIYLEVDEDGEWQPVAMPGYHAFGACKVVRRQCFEQIGGFLTTPGWDTVDEIRAWRFGWRTRHFPELRVRHHRPEGSGMGPLMTSVMHGEIYYLTGGDPLLLPLKLCTEAVDTAVRAQCGGAGLWLFRRGPEGQAAAGYYRGSSRLSSAPAPATLWRGAQRWFADDWSGDLNMCGICGIFDRSGRSVDQDLLGRMTLAIAHRGPDGDGQLVDREVGLGHRRLSIIDLGGGAQPIANEDRRLQVVFNGEIYNFVELREELEGFGHQFKTRSDTEVIVHAYEQWGKDCVQRFNGMFVFALWDAATREVFIARDHLGVKPLYYTNLGSRTLFASEIKALLEDPACPRDVDPHALSELFTLRYVPSPKTLFKGIHKLPPGHHMTISALGIEDRAFLVPRAASTKRLHGRGADRGIPGSARRCHSPPAAERRSARSVPELRRGFGRAPGRHERAPLRAGERVYDRVRWRRDGTNEVDDARELASMFGAKHEFMMVGPDDYVKYYERYMWDLEEPVGNETAAAFYFVSNITARHVKVALSGQGADEPWAGYDRYLGAKFSKYYSRIPSALTTSMAQVIARIPGRLERLKRSAVALGEPDVLTRFAKMYSFFSADMRQQLFNADLQQQLPEDGYHAREALRYLQTDVRDLDPLTQMLYLDTRDEPARRSVDGRRQDVDGKLARRTRAVPRLPARRVRGKPPARHEAEGADRKVPAQAGS